VSNFTSKIGTDISSFSVNTTTDSSEKSDSGTTETISRDVLEEHADLFLDSLTTFFSVVSVSFSDDNWLVDEDEDLEYDEGEADEHVSENLSTSESNIKAFMDGNSTFQGDFNVGVGSNLHSDKSASHGGDGTNNEGESSERERDLVFGLVRHPGHVDGAYEDDGEDGAEDSEVGVFLLQESDGTLRKENKIVSLKLKNIVTNQKASSNHVNATKKHNSRDGIDRLTYLFDVDVGLHHAVETGLIGPGQEVERLVSLLVGVLVDSDILDIRFDVFDL
jgi:hypothetical protein